jgi:hypothetical protein
MPASYRTQKINIGKNVPGRVKTHTSRLLKKL